jgi:hypothetical protein
MSVRSRETFPRTRSFFGELRVPHENPARLLGELTSQRNTRGDHGKAHQNPDERQESHVLDRH